MKNNVSLIRTSIFNQDIVWKDKKENFQRIEEHFSTIDTDLIVLPEMFPVGFCMDADSVADRDNETLDWMVQFSKDKNAAVCGSAPVFEEGHFYNRLFFVKPDGEYHTYDKRHLFSYSGEDQVYTPGKNRVVVSWMGMRFLLQICYDLRFPVFSRNRDDYDAMIYVANWPKARVEAWNHLLKARAIENLSYVLGCNRIGIDGNDLEYVESSSVFFADGSLVSTIENNTISADLDLENVKKFRERFQFLGDRDDFQIQE